MTTFETKTICLISRYPYWTAFRRFLLHLHFLSTSTSSLPLERYISHLLLAVPVPKPGSRSIYIPLETLVSGMRFYSPPAKDLPLLDLPFERLFAVLDVKTVVMVVFGLLALERKVIVMSTHPSLVLDGSELLRSLLFPFELCAPYVPRLTQPFMSCLDFPGAIFVGIHDDGTPDGLASLVRKDLPEDCILLDFDTGEIECKAEDQFEVLRQSWSIIPSAQRASLIAEIETLCKDAGIVPGQEPVDSQVDAAFDVSIPSNHTLVEDYYDDRKANYVNAEPLDDRAVRDAFLRFFCAILGGYERYLVVPDVDFLISGNEWFDAQRFLAAAPPELAKYLGSFVTTQLFQSFIQRRTEASDVHCVLFDECLMEFHASSFTYGRLGVEDKSVLDESRTEPADSCMLFSLLVDQFAATHQESLSSLLERSLVVDGHQPLSALSGNPSNTTGSDADTSLTGLGGFLGKYPTSSIAGGASTVLTCHSRDTSWTGGGIPPPSNSLDQHTGDIVAEPSLLGLPTNKRFVYCVDGFPCFPQTLDTSLFFPKEPTDLSADFAEAPVPVLTRSDGELEEANRRRRIATSNRSSCLHNQRRCLWQLPKLMASHFLGSWLMCIPSQVSQPCISQEHQARYLLRALGATRLLRARQRIVPDEAAYRCLMVACGRTESDRRVELVKLFGLLRHDGIFPSAVTLGQYTRAIAEGFSKRSISSTNNSPSDADHGANMKDTQPHPDGALGYEAIDFALNQLDENLYPLEDAGRRWRQRETKNDIHTSAASGNDEGGIHNIHAVDSTTEDGRDTSMSDMGHNDASSQKTTEKQPDQRIDAPKAPRKNPALWNPIHYSSSFSPISETYYSQSSSNEALHEEEFEFTALWSRASTCESCYYIPLDEEIQSGWDEAAAGALSCPRCNSASIVPQIGYRVMSFSDALANGGRPHKLSQHVKTFSKYSAETSSGRITPLPVHTTDADEDGNDGEEETACLQHPQLHRPPSQKQEDAQDYDYFPPQLTSSLTGQDKDDTSNHTNDDGEANKGYVSYLSPSALRISLEQLIEKYGEAILERETLQKIDLQLFYNLWWYCARFSLPLPLPIAPPTSSKSTSDATAIKPSSSVKREPRHESKQNESRHKCCFVAWDESMAEQGCYSGAAAVRTLIDFFHAARRSSASRSQSEDSVPPSVKFSIFPNGLSLLSYFSLQSYVQEDWEHPDLSEILITLVEACDKRDFRPVLDCVLRCNRRRRQKICSKRKQQRETQAIPKSGESATPEIKQSETTTTANHSPQSVEIMDPYRTILYLARYQCTSAFHVFFPTISKPCKGYHFWCVTGTPLPMFDRLFREAEAAIGRQRGNDAKSVPSLAPVYEVSDVALGFRCVFGHVI